MNKQDIVDQLLRDIGIDIEEQEQTAAPIAQGLQPIRFDDKVAIFDTDQIDLFGPPELYGYTNYQVIESSAHMVADWSFEQGRERARPIHRYNRVERFEFTLAQLLGLRGDIPYYVMAVMEYADKTPDKCYNSIRSILKHYKFRKYYNRIPQIMFRLGLGNVFEWDRTDTTYRAIVNDFRKLQALFEQKKKFEWKRKYFPPLRFIAIKLIERYGGKCNFDINFIRTKRKQKSLGDIWTGFEN